MFAEHNALGIEISDCFSGHAEGPIGIGALLVIVRCQLGATDRASQYKQTMRLPGRARCQCTCDGATPNPNSARISAGRSPSAANCSHALSYFSTASSSAMGQYSHSVSVFAKRVHGLSPGRN